MENQNSKAKVLLVYRDIDDNIQIESVWAEKAGEYYKIINIPFFANNIAYGDIVDVEEDDGSLYFDELIQPSGHSTVQMIIFNPDELEMIGKDLIQLGCDWEGSHLKGYISVDIPETVKYNPVKKYLENGEATKRFSYKEACLSSAHRNE